MNKVSSASEQPTSTPPRLLLLSATEFEVAPLTEGLRALALTPALPDGWRARTGTIGGAACVAVATGVGKVNAAALAALAVNSLRPSVVLVVGIGGAFPGADLHVGEVAMALSETHMDTGVGHGAAWSGMESMGFPLLPATTARPTPAYNRFELPATVTALAERIGVMAAHFGTAEAVTADPHTARLLAHTHGVAVESMEGAAVAQVAAALGLPAFELRGVSNMVGDRDKANWRVPDAVAAACAAARRLIPLLLEEQ